MNPNFFAQTLDIQTRSLEAQEKQTFKGGNEVVDPHPFAWKTPTLPGSLRAQKLGKKSIFVFFFFGPETLRVLFTRFVDVSVCKLCVSVLQTPTKVYVPFRYGTREEESLGTHFYPVLLQGDICHIVVSL